MAQQFDYQAILDTYRQLHDQANAANEQRYQDILTRDAANQERVGATYGQAFDLLENLGESQAERIEIRGTRDFAQAEQDLISRGLGNTTIRESVRRGVGEDVARGQRELTEQVGRQKAGVLQARAGAEERMGAGRTGIMERRTDQGPDLGSLYGLLSQAGAGAGAQEAAGQTIFTGLSANARAGLDAFGQPSRFGPSRTTESGQAEDPRFGLRGGSGGPSGTAYVLGASGQRMPIGNGRSFAAAGGNVGAGGGGVPPTDQPGAGGAGGAGVFGFRQGQAQPTGDGQAPMDVTQPQGTGAITPTGGGAGFEAKGGEVSPTGGGGRTATIRVRSVHAQAPIGSTRTVQIPAGMTNAEFMAGGGVPWGWGFAD